MIFYFSGTGNSRYCAQELAKSLGEQMISIPDVMHMGQSLDDLVLLEGETVGFVFPIYAWAPPKIVLDFIKGMKGDHTSHYVFSLATCADEEGNATALIRSALSRRGITLDSSFTMRMPNNYILGFDVDSPEIEHEKLQEAASRLSVISTILIARKREINMLIPGRFSVIKTSIFNPLFQRFAIRTDSFFTTDACTKCGLCARICPVHTILLADKPTWGQACTQCLGCINRCPEHAIQYGKGTMKRGRYVHPLLKHAEK